MGRSLVVILAVALFAGVNLARASVLPVETIGITTERGVARFHVEVAADDASRERGLMYRRHLAPDEGMLFDFHSAQDVSFWMKNTFIPLDMLFVAADGRIVRIAASATPQSERPIPSGAPVRWVIEIAGGRAGEIGAKAGDRADIP